MRKKEFIFQKVFPYILSCSLIMGSVLPVSADASTEINGSISASAIDISASSTANYTINGKTLTSDTIGILNNSNFPISVGVASVDKTIGTISDVLPSDVGDQAAWFNLGRRESNSKIALGLKHTSGDYLEEFASDTVYFKSVQDATDAIPLGAVAASGNANYEIDGFHGLAFSSNVSEQYKITWEIGLYEGTGNDSSSGSDEGNVATYSVDKEETTVLNYDLTNTTQTASTFSLDDLLGIHTVSADPIDVPQDEVVNVVGTAVITGLKDDTVSELYIADYYQDAEGNYYKITGVKEGKSNAGTIVGDNLETVVFPEGITEIPDYAFRSCFNLKNVVIPNTVTRIGNGAFQKCDLSNFSFEENSQLEIIADNAFNATKLTSIEIPESVKEIGNSAFYSNLSLTDVTIPYTVTSIGSKAFNSTPWMTAQIDASENGLIIVGDGILINGTKASGDIVIPKTVKSIAKNAFDGSSIENVKFEEESQLTIIDHYYFTEISSLKSIVLPSNLSVICGSAFYFCTNLTEVTIPSSVTIIGNSAFGYCTSLTTVNYRGTEEQWNNIEIDNNDYGIGNNNYLTNATINYNYTE